MSRRLKWNGDEVLKQAKKRAAIELAQLGQEAGREAGKAAADATNAEMKTHGSGQPRKHRPRRSADLSKGEIPRSQSGRSFVVADEPVVTVKSEPEPSARVEIPFRAAAGDRLDQGRTPKETRLRKRNWKAWFSGPKVRAAMRKALDK